MSVPTVRQRWLAAGALAVVWAVGTADARLAGWPIDLEVYRAAGEVWRQGHRLYLAGYPYGLGPYLPCGLSISLPEPVSSVDLAEARRRAPGPVLRRLGEAGGS